ncbi:nucleolus protein required for cell viability [Aspergillus indologenus CBS 114.80]|uniref:Nucleolus protein required for cell viability n=1 Tax=Aspergillus indologenus CBS 114.80 TaxID=1450541 RepID=A0A2V5IDH5_9EURO|nr:nucleolus protein required for cell viability [Aspergillus indologenus CBS 114.80]
MTGATCSKLDDLPIQDGIVLTDQEIEQLLLEAEDRLQGCDVERSKESNQTQGTDSLPEQHSIRIPKLSGSTALEPYLHPKDDVALVDTARLLPQQDYNDVHTRRPSGANQDSKSSKMKPTAGSDWFDLPKTELTAELRRDLQLLRMRSVLDPKRHYKKENSKAQPPTYSQIGTIIEGPTEFFSGRIAKKDRKKTFVDEALALEKETKRFETKYRDIQATKQSGKKAYYKNLRSRRNARGK